MDNHAAPFGDLGHGRDGPLFGVRNSLTGVRPGSL